MVRRKCCVPGCATKDGPGRKFSLFKIPNDNELLKEWKKIINYDFDPAKFICEKHFQPHYVRCDFFAENEKGQVLLNVSIN